MGEAMEPAEDDDGLEAGRDRAWEMLDFLPKGAAHPSLAATTIEMAAVTTVPDIRGGMPRPSMLTWPRVALAVPLLLASLAVGFAVGGYRRETVLEGPVAVVAAITRHLPVLKEAGSVEFLEQFSKRDIPLPRRFVGPRGPAFEEPSAREPYPELEAAIADFREAFAADADGLAPRPFKRPVERPAERQTERPPEAFAWIERIPAAERQAAVVLARALADPARSDLRDAAARWHQWVLASDPVERRILPTLGTKDRLEWLIRRSRRGMRPPPG